MMKAIFDKVELGEWVHIFPEGKIVQNESKYFSTCMHALCYRRLDIV
jgi:hypothetical protein